MLDYVVLCYCIVPKMTNDKKRRFVGYSLRRVNKRIPLFATKTAQYYKSLSPFAYDVGNFFNNRNIKTWGKFFLLGYNHIILSKFQSIFNGMYYRVSSGLQIRAKRFYWVVPYKAT